MQQKFGHHYPHRNKQNAGIGINQDIQICKEEHVSDLWCHLQGLLDWALLLTDGINLIHKDDAWLVVSGIVEHLSDEPCTLTDVLVHNGARHDL